MTEALLAALAEWRDARHAIFENPLSNKSQEQWARLAVAEHRLMDIAETLPPCPK